MLFNSSEFILYFLPATAAGFYFLVYLRQWTLAKYWLIAASFYFYGRWNPRDGILLLGLLCINFVIGALLYRHEEFGPRSILAIGVAINLGVLGYFKYGGFVVDNLNIFWPMPIAFAAPVLPLAISFFTFQKIAYLVDKAKGRLGKVNFGDFVLFVSFFPQLIAGPIVHFREVAPQWRDTDWAARIVSSVPTAIIFFSIGLFKKTIIADTIGGYINPIFEFNGAGGNLDAIRAWQAALGYTAQLYFDFSGYSDMAIGLALLLGIRLPINFLSPYKATCIVDFWRSWNITLTRFLTQYLYIPLGGNRRSMSRRFLNIMVVMLLGGLWHGAQWTFVAWGALHGLYVVVNHAWRAWRPWRNAGRSFHGAPALAWAVTFLCVVIAWVLFRANSFTAAFSMLRAMAGANGLIDHVSLVQQAQRSSMTPVLLLRDIKVSAIWIAIALTVTFLCPNLVELTGYKEPPEEGARGAAALAGLATCTASISSRTLNPFLCAGAGLALGTALWAVFASAPSEFLYFRF